MKKLLFVLTLSTVSFIGRAGEAQDAHPGLAPAVHSEPVKITDYLYGVNYLSWQEELANMFAEMVAIGDDNDVPQGGLAAGCSAVRAGDFVGRNFDWHYSDLDEYLVRTTADGGRHATIGVATSIVPELMLKEAAKMFGIDDFDFAEFMPMMTMDGINDQGVMANINIVIAGSAGNTTGTNPGAERLCAGYAVRYVLDNADSAAHAVELLKQRDIFAIDLGLGSALEAHFLIADKKETYIVECVSNSLVVLRSPERKPLAMTNFHVACSPYSGDYETVYDPRGLVRTEYTPYPGGIERYDRAMAMLPTATTIDDIFNICTTNWYTQMYDRDNDSYWWSEPYGDIMDDGKDPQHRMSYYDGSDYDWLMRQNLENGRVLFAEVCANEKAGNGRVDNEGNPLPEVWQTVHTSIYDLDTKSLKLYVQENPTPYEFGMDFDPPDVAKKARKYNGYYSAGGALLGTVQVKAAKAKTDRNTKAPVTTALSITVQPAKGRKFTLKGNYDLRLGGGQTFSDRNGNEVTIDLGAKVMTGSVNGAMVLGIVEGGDASAFAGVYNIISDDGVFTVTLNAKGKVSVKGTTAAGKSVSATSQLMVFSEAEAVAPVVMQKYGLSFAFGFGGGGIAVEGLENGYAGRPCGISENARFNLGAGIAIKDVMVDEKSLPNETGIVQEGKKWAVTGDNPSKLKLTYTEKTGAFKGSFKVYGLDAKGRKKNFTAKVTGVSVGNFAYGIATVKGTSVPVVIMDAGGNDAEMSGNAETDGMGFFIVKNGEDAMYGKYEISDASGTAQGKARHIFWRRAGAENGVPPFWFLGGIENGLPAFWLWLVAGVENGVPMREHMLN